MPKITRHNGVSDVKADRAAAALDVPDTDDAEPVDAAPKTRRRGRHEAPVDSA